MIEVTDRFKQAENAYLSNPNDVKLAIDYSHELSSLISSNFRNRNATNDLRHLHDLLYSVYKKHSYNKEVAMSYLYGVNCLTEYFDESIFDRMIEIAHQFPDDEYLHIGLRAKSVCATAIANRVVNCCNRRDVARAEKTMGYLERLYTYYPADENIAVTYADALQILHNAQQGFFSRRNTANKIKKLAQQFPYNESIRQTAQIV